MTSEPSKPQWNKVKGGIADAGQRLEGVRDCSYWLIGGPIRRCEVITRGEDEKWISIFVDKVVHYFFS